jgi:aminomethyltransferase
MKVGQVRYALICNPDGGILDDVLIYNTDIPEAHPYLMVVNASNRAKIKSWIREQMNEWQELTGNRVQFVFDDRTASAMIAVQGPNAVRIIDTFVGGRLSALKYYTGLQCTFNRHRCYVSRTGYTGEDGCEIICDRADALSIWKQVLDSASAVGGMACGLGARDTLRLEAAMPLYGHELSETINPFQAGLGFAVNLEGRDFVGRDALVRFAADNNQPIRVGLQLDAKRVPRQGCAVLQGQESVGEVTSGTFSPTFERPIAMAYVRPSAQAVGTRLAVDIRGTRHPAVVVPLPFYQRGKT